MEYIYTYVGGIPDFEILSLEDYRLRFGIEEAKGFLEQIRGTLITEAKDKCHPQCLYTGLRHTFSEIDGLGKLYKGEYNPSSSARNAVAFGVDYLGRVNPKYKCLFGLMYDMYRHGLTHGHLVKGVRYQNKQKHWSFILWKITTERATHLQLKKHTDNRHTYTWLVVSVPQFVDDTVSALKHFADDLQAKGPESELFSQFKEGYLGIGQFWQEQTVSDPKTVRKKTGQKPLRMSWYAQDGINLIRDNE